MYGGTEGAAGILYSPDRTRKHESHLRLVRQSLHAVSESASIV